MIVPVMTLKGVPIFPFGFIAEAGNRANSRTAWRAFRALPVSLFFLFMVFPLVPVFGEIVQADEEGRPQNEDKGDAVQEPRRVLRGRHPRRRDARRLSAGRSRRCTSGCTGRRFRTRTSVCRGGTRSCSTGTPCTGPCGR